MAEKTDITGGGGKDSPPPGLTSLANNAGEEIVPTCSNCTGMPFQAKNPTYLSMTPGYTDWCVECETSLHSCANGDGELIAPGVLTTTLADNHFVQKLQWKYLYMPPRRDTEWDDLYRRSSEINSWMRMCEISKYRKLSE